MAAKQVGWIGLGSMGIGMSRNLQKFISSSGAPSLIYTNRTLSRGDSLKELGAIPAETVGEVARKSDVIFSCVSNDAVLQDTANEIIKSGDITNKIYVDCSTVHPDTSAAISKQITEAGGQFVAGECQSRKSFSDLAGEETKLHQAPVFGAAPMAAAGKLIFVTAGPESATSAISLYLTGVMGRSVIPMGTDVTKSSLLKIAGNIVVVSFMEVLSEAHVFAEKTGLGSPVLENMVSDMFGPVLESYSKRITSGSYAPPPDGKAGFDVALAMKDLRHALTCAKDAGTRLETCEAALRHMEKAREFETERPLDSSSMYGAVRLESGLDFYSDACKERDAKK
ncbi:Putative 6-phosphogluconate dehydrogenase, NADP-binding, 6-phosphogluconate dehydrogenase, domain 2 [Colletotrichum destructivum]|uniref:6-phosphogluconate dehydrogenase, NADP-binding, 6-phosphogluconate dehydrogenase, domain 2 n=1 Tax=Colletotrichum destructivum TaxID=34406 RepID=A0AAX4I6C6_9PEZI|nr:Putative 6-phosphogluconate dehydrogenase, NADP-binding, 6-phosphogluconate dehydrogenase, domain 2 [Colletotrichum destructivum]